MIRDVTLGQYFPGDTAIHRLDPRAKLILTIVYIVALFMAKSYVSYGVVIVFIAWVIFVSHVKLKNILRGIKPLIFIISFTAILNMFYTQSGRVLISFWIFTITTDGLIRAIFMVLRIVMLVVGTSVLTYTTSPMSLTDGMESLMGPLKRIKVPVHELSMMMSTALRFIPTLIEETDKIMSAQKARGADFETGSIVQRAKALIPVLVPLFVSAFRRADELAIAMESRCYRGGEGRTRMKQMKYTGIDYAAYATGIILLIVVVMLTRVNM